MKALSIVGIIFSVFSTILVALALNEVRCSYCQDRFVHPHNLEAVMLVVLPTNLFFLALSIVGLITSNKLKRLKKGHSPVA